MNFQKTKNVWRWLREQCSEKKRLKEDLVRVTQNYNDILDAYCDLVNNRSNPRSRKRLNSCLMSTSGGSNE